MQIQFSFKNTKITQRDEEKAEEKLFKIQQFAEVKSMEVVVEFFPNLPQNESFKVSVTTELVSSEKFKNEESGKTFMEALNKVQEEVLRSAKKEKEKFLAKKEKGRILAKKISHKDVSEEG